MLRRHGYGCQIFKVTTDDGYINTLHRILPRPSSQLQRRGPGNQTRKVVFLQHGLLGTSADYVMGSPEKSLGRYRYNFDRQIKPSVIKNEVLYMLMYLKGTFYPIWDMTYGWEMLEETSIPEDIPHIMQMTLISGSSGEFRLIRK